MIGGSVHAQPAPVQAFTFARITDTHIGNGGTNVAANAARVADINRLDPEPAFVINCGDLVDEGTASQYRVYEDTFRPLTMPRYDVPGNHDVRWAPLGKESIQDAIHIPLYRSFDSHGCHFVLLDSTVTLEHWGHFDASELRWLKEDLRKTGTAAPVFLFFHHWVGRDAVMVDNEDEFFQIIAPYNVKIVFCGHGHADIQWRLNGVQYVMERGLYQGSFDFTRVTPETVMLYRQRKEDPAPILLAAMPTGRSSALSLDARLEPGGKLQAALWEGKAEPGAAWEWRVDSGGRWQAMTANPSGAGAAAEVNESSLSPGHHVLHIRLVNPLPADRKLESHDQTGDGGDAWQVSLPLDAAPAGAAITEQWRTPLGGGIQSKLTYDRGTVYVSCTDGVLYALDARTGKPRWKFKTGGSLYGTPCIHQGKLFIASMDHHVYAVDAATGKQIWQAPLGGPAFAGVQVGDGIVCVGAGDGVIYGLEENTGRPRWTYKTDGFVQQQAAFGEHAFYVGAWDNGFYALDAATGALRWKKRFGRSFFYSPSIGAPAIYADKVYVPSDDDTLHAVVMKTGDVAWEVHAPDGAGSFGYSGPAITADGRIYIGALGGAGSVLCLDAGTGQVLWRTDTGSVIYDSSPVVAGGVCSIGSVDGSFHVLNARTGTLAGSFMLGPGHLLASPAASSDGRMVFIGSLDNAVSALRVPAGAQP